MARGVNKVILIGNLGQDPEVRFMPSGGAVANINIATTEVWNDRQSGQRQERTEWHRVVFFNKLAEVVQQYLKKGSRVYVEGKLQTRKWQDQNGVDRYTTEIVSNDMQMLDSMPQGGQQGGYQQQGGQQQGGYQQQGGQQQGGYQQQGGQQQGGYQQQGNQAPAPQQQGGQQQGNQAPAPQQQGGQQQGGSASGSFDDFDDEIPF